MGPEDPFFRRGVDDQVLELGPGAGRAKVADERRQPGRPLGVARAGVVLEELLVIRYACPAGHGGLAVKIRREMQKSQAPPLLLPVRVSIFFHEPVRQARQGGPGRHCPRNRRETVGSRPGPRGDRPYRGIHRRAGRRRDTSPAASRTSRSIRGRGRPPFTLREKLPILDGCSGSSSRRGRSANSGVRLLKTAGGTGASRSPYRVAPSSTPILHSLLKWTSTGPRNSEGPPVGLMLFSPHT